MNKIKYIILLLLTMYFAQGVAQTSISVDEYMRKVIDYSHQIEISRESTSTAMSSQAAAKTGFLPKLDANGNYSYQFKKIGFDFGGANIFMNPHAYQMQAALVQNIYSGRAVKNQYEMSKINTEIAQITEKMTLDNVTYAAEYNYWNLSANTELMEVSNKNLGIVNQLYKLVNERFEGGLISRTDLMMVETRLKEAEYQNANIQNIYKVAIQNFNILMGKPLKDNYIISDTILKVTPMPAFVSLETALENRPDYKIANKSIDYQKYGVKLAGAKYNPQLVAGVSGQWGTQSLNFDGSTKLYGATYLQLNVPIFHWGERRSTVKASKSQLAISERQREQVIDDIDIELNNAITMITETAQQVQIAEASLSIASESLKLNIFSYNEGKLTILDVLTAQTSWLQSYTNTITANFNNKLAIAQYKKIIGNM